MPEFYNYMTPAQYLKLCGEVIGLSKSCISKRSQELLSLVGLNGAAKQIGGFSRGMKQRLGIAQALFTQPKLLICDEPTTALDVTIQAQILKLINKMKKELNTAVLLITHDMGVISEMADNVIVMYAGKIV